MSSDTTTVTMPSDVEIEMTRIFDAPLALVFATHTEPEHLRRWQLGPDGWTMPICEIDLRVGGAWRSVWRSTEGRGEFQISGEFLEVDAPHRLVQTERMGDGPQSVSTLVFSEHDGRTLLTTTMRFPTRELRDEVLATGMTDGAAVSYDRLDTHLLTLAR